MKLEGKSTALALILAAAVGLLLTCEKLDLFALAQQVPLSGGRDWSGYEMVVDVGGATYSNNLSNPCVIKDGSLFRLWLGASDGSTFRIHHAQSADGRVWTTPVVVLGEGSYDGFTVTSTGRPSVLKLGGTYKMWFSGSVAGVDRIFYAVSADGLAWSGHRLVVSPGSQGTFDATGVYSPCVIKDGALYKLWYTGQDASLEWRILYAESSDGISWGGFRMSVDTGSQGSYDVSRVGNPTILKDNLVYRLWYDGRDAGSVSRIIRAQSADGIAWSEFRLAVDVGAQGVYDTTNVSGPTVISDLGVGKMWYNGNNGTQRLLYAYSP